MNVGLPQCISRLPGVATTQAAASTRTAHAAAAGAEPQALVYEGSGANAQSNARMDVRRDAFAADLQGNPVLAAQLAQAATPADARGLARVAGLAMRHSAAFAAVVDSARDVGLSMGQNPAAITRYNNAASAFTSTAGLQANNNGDLVYLVTRIVSQTESQSQQQVRERLQGQIQNNLKIMDAMRQYEAGLHEKVSRMGPNSTTKVAESDFQLNDRGQVERVQDNSPDSKLDTSMPATKAGPDVPSVATSASKPPKVVVMSTDRLRAEIEETQAQIRALENANRALNACLTQDRASKGEIQASWFALREPQGQS